MSRDLKAREEYREEVRNNKTYKNDLFIMDIIREEIDNNDSRIQRIVSK